MPKVSVLIPVFNGEKFILESLNSILNQTFQDFEIIIIDDYSTDNTISIINSINDNRIKLFKNSENLKIIRTLNKGILHCNGTYIVRMDADDISLPNRIESQVAFMDKNPDIVLSGCSINRFSENYSIKDLRGGDDATIRSKLLFDTAINHPSAIIRHSVIIENKLEYPKEYLHTEDYALWYEISQFGKLANLGEVLLRYRMHGNNLSMQNNKTQYQNMNRMRIRIMNDFLEKSKVTEVSKVTEEYLYLLSLDKVTIFEMKRMDDLLVKIIKINETSKVYDDKGIKEAASWFWYVVFTHENCEKYSWRMLSLFLWNKKSICYYLAKQYRRKLLVKSILKLRKRI
ncbi:glycosyltransferase family 2 protein [Rhizosphaericola mali]|uniref:Glycosyltransferase n=1 Tax=Rhizosphaericola mali TaxID=2545455 RepID=A0A5P2G193_9BACT|nr:glycosyltransferase [Rhizosphaericola mali]QES89195.1 glycosyltransferase [Rhizosphaericola mali]